jgi:hypothetical protein
MSEEMFVLNGQRILVPFPVLQTSQDESPRSLFLYLIDFSCPIDIDDNAHSTKWVRLGRSDWANRESRFVAWGHWAPWFPNGCAEWESDLCG